MTPVRARWIDRVLGVAAGSLLTAWFMRRDPAPTPVVVEATAVGGDEAAVVPQALPVEPSAAIRPSPEPLPVAVAPTTAVAPQDHGRLARGPAVATPAATPAAAAVPDEPRPLPADAPSSEAPPLPLPRMPGDTRLSNSARFDPEAQTWILKAAYRVHARDHHVIGFYRKALADQGLEVTLSEDPPTADGAVKTYLHGKSARVHAQVGILPRTDALETRVWILWRSRA